MDQAPVWRLLPKTLPDATWKAVAKVGTITWPLDHPSTKQLGILRKSNKDWAKLIDLPETLEGTNPNPRCGESQYRLAREDE